MLLTWITTHLTLLIIIVSALVLAWIIKNTWWRVWYPVSIAVLGLLIKYRERKASRG